MSVQLQRLNISFLQRPSSISASKGSSAFMTAVLNVASAFHASIGPLSILSALLAQSLKRTERLESSRCQCWALNVNEGRWEIWSHNFTRWGPILLMAGHNRAGGHSEGEVNTLLHIATISGVLATLMRHFRASLSSLPLLNQPVANLPMGTWSPDAQLPTLEGSYAEVIGQDTTQPIQDQAVP